MSYTYKCFIWKYVGNTLGLRIDVLSFDLLKVCSDNDWNTVYYACFASYLFTCGAVLK